MMKNGNWLASLLEAVDAQDTARFLDHLTPDAVFRFGSRPAARGRQEIATAVDGFFSTIEACRHSFSKAWFEEDTIACEGEVTYRRHDRSEITLPFVNVFGLDGDLISSYRIYIDIGPLYAR